MDAKELIKKVRKIEIKTKRLSQDLFSGGYQSSFKGKGMTFSEVREYQYGDDVRIIDWNVTARLNHPYIKIFDEERELTVVLLIDLSKSEYFGTQSQTKRELLTEIAAVISFSAIHNQDKIGVIFFTDKIEKFIPPKKGKTHALRIIRELLDFEPSGSTTDISEALQYTLNVIKKRSIVFLISDFIGDNYFDALKICGKKHDTVAMQIWDKREAELPSMGLVKIEDAETGLTKWLDTSSKRIREHYKTSFLERQQKLEKFLSKHKIDQIKIATDESFIQPLLKFFKNREKKR